MQLSSLLRVSNEKIAYQHNSLFFKELVKEFEILQEADLTPKTLVNSRLAAITRRHTGMSIIPHLLERSPFTACVSPPRLDRNNPMFNSIQREFTGNTDFYKIINDKKAVLKGSVDLAAGKVSGVFSEIDLDVFLGTNWFEPKYFTPQETAAVFLHEMGHPFGCFEYIGETVRTNTVLAAVGQVYEKELPTEKKIALLHEVDEALGTKLPSKDKLAGGKSTVVQSVIIREKAKVSRSALKSDFYDQRTFEFIADQFAINHGAGIHLAGGLSKLQRFVKAKNGVSKGRFWFFEVIKVLVFFTSIPGFYNLLMNLLIVASSENSYDRPKVRIRRMREQLQIEIKDKKLPAKQRDALLDDIAILNKVEKETLDRLNVVEFIWAKVLPWGRRDTDVTTLQEQLESMAGNRLYTNAAKFKQLAK